MQSLAYLRVTSSGTSAGGEAGLLFGRKVASEREEEIIGLLAGHIEFLDQFSEETSREGGFRKGKASSG